MGSDMSANGNPIRAIIYARGDKFLCVRNFKNYESLNRFVMFICPKIYPHNSGFYYEITNN